MSFQNTVNRLISRLLPGAVTLLAAWLVSGCAAIHSTPYLSYLSVTPDATSIALGQTAQFKVMATYSNGVSDDVSASVTWKTLAPDIASVDASGVASSMAVGKATVVATMSGVSGFAEITVSQAALESLTITAPTSSLDLGQSAQLKASGTYSDKSVQDVTNLVSWSAAQPNVVTVNAAGLAVSKATGSTQITASLNNINASSQITVSPAALVSMAVVSKDTAVPLGVSEQFHAVGTYTDGSTADLTGAASWTSSAPGVVSINATGAAATRTVGSALITAAVAGTSGAATFTVSPAALVSIAVSASRSSLPLGGAEQLTATGAYTDGSTRDLTASATWTSSSSGILSVSSAGAVKTISVGTAAVSASLSGITGSASLTVSTAALAAIRISSASTTVPVGDTLQLSAIGSFTDGSTQDLTDAVNWTSSTPGVVSVRGAGLVAGVATGVAGVSASSGSISGVASISVSGPVLSSMSLSPAAPTVLIGRSLQLAVVGTFSDGSTQNVTSQVAWNVDTAAIAAVSAGGLVIAQQVGSTGIEASLNGVQTSDTLTVMPLLTVAYFDATSGGDSSIRITNPATTGQDLCAMVYVFDQDQQMSECCGCHVSRDGLLTLSLNKDLRSNPLTGVASKAGTVMLVAADYAASSPCNAAAATPNGTVIAWSTKLPQSSQLSSTENTFSNSPLGATLAAALQAQCYFIQQLGSGQGQCGCGASH
jgi:hypothetical protein